MPSSTFKTTWNIVIIILLLYTSTVVPYQVAFVEADNNLSKFLNYMVDILFVFDICINFLSAYETVNGRYETRIRKIVVQYLTTWFLFDLAATFPTNLLADTTDYNKLARLARLPRLYRLVRLMRIFKILKVFKYNRKFNQWFGICNMSATTKKMVVILMLMLLMVHLVSCFWYLSAKLDLDDEGNFRADTWLGRNEQYQAWPDIGKYFICVYWAF